jgi:hypothetical protein
MFCNLHNMNNTNKIQKEIETSNKLTTISISKENYFILKSIGNTGDSFNDVLSRVLKNNYLLESDRN